MSLHQPSGLREKLDRGLVIHGLQMTENPSDTGNSKA